MRLFRITEKYNNLSEKLGDVAARPVVSFASLIIYKALLDFIFCLYIGPKYPFFDVTASAVNAVNGWIMVIFSGFALRYYYKNESASSIMMVALHMIYFIPITTFCAYGGGASSFLFYAGIYWVLLVLLQWKLPVITMKPLNSEVSGKLFYALMFFFSIVSLYIWAKYADFRILLSLLDVYDVRLEAAKVTMPTILAYIRQFSGIVVPMLILLALVKRKYVSLVWLLFITLINFSYAGNKTVILFPVLLVGGYVFYRKKMLSLVFPGGILLALLAIVEELIAGPGQIISLFFRRMGIVLAQLSEYNYRFFLENDTDIFRNSIMSKFGFESIYNQTLANVIGNNFETQVVNCNNGLMADVWSGLGVIGVFVMPVIMIICFRLFDFVSNGMDSRVIVSLAVYYAMTFTNATWSTVLITHGFVIMCVMLVVFPRKSEHR